jgi:hypothetical protein
MAAFEPKADIEILHRPNLDHGLYAVGQRIKGGRRSRMAKGQVRSNKEARKPKKVKPKSIAANPSQHGGQRGLENLNNS